MNKQYQIGDIVIMKKNHPCKDDAFSWQIIRVGADFKIKCLNCNHIVTLTRYELSKRIKQN